MKVDPGKTGSMSRFLFKTGLTRLESSRSIPLVGPSDWVRGCNLMYKRSMLAAIAILCLMLAVPSISTPVARAQNCPSSNGQCPSRQINSSNTSNDYGAWVRLSLTVYQSFYFSTTSGEFDFQVNSLVNGGSPGCGYSCNYPWWLQGFTDLANSYTGAAGVWVVDSGIEEWNSITPTNICYLYPTPPNINFSGYLVQDEFFLVSSTQAKNALTILYPNGHVYYTGSTTCSYPGLDTVAYMNRLEAVVVGCCNSEHATFKPLNSEIFENGIIDMTSNFNHMTSATTYDGQTAETSNLYQTGVSTSTGTYGSLYLYSISLTENTKSST